MFKFFSRNKNTNKDNTLDILDESNKDIKNIETELELELKLESEPDAKPGNKKSFFNKLKDSLTKTRKQIFSGNRIKSLFTGRVNIDEDLWEELETHLLLADVGVEVTNEILEELSKEIKYKDSSNVNNLKEALKNILLEILKPCEKNLNITSCSNTPFVLLMVGVNGAGKTTTIGKIASKFKNQNKSILLAAGDTFRAAAIEQLITWGERNSVPVVAQKQGSDSASVIFDGYQSAIAKNTDLFIADTAGRLHTQSHLMQELAKIKRVLKKQNEHAPHEVLLVLDASMGQNALQQVKQFQQVVDVSGIVFTKLDGTAKAGVIFAIAKQFALPIRYIGIGEGKEDLQEFNAKDFVDALIGD